MFVSIIVWVLLGLRELQLTERKLVVPILHTKNSRRDIDRSQRLFVGWIPFR